MAKIDKVQDELLTASANGDFATVQSIIAYLNEADGIRSKLDPDVLGQVLINTVSYTQDPEGSVQTADLILASYADVIDPSYIGQSLSEYAQNGNLDGVNIVVDHLSPEIVAQLDPWGLGDTLWAITFAHYYGGVEIADVNATIDHFLDATADQIEPAYLEWTMNELAQNGNLEGVNIVVDHLTPEIVAQLDPWALGDTLWAITFAHYYGGVEVADVNATINHFLDATADQIEPAYLEWTMNELAQNGNLEGVNIVVDHLSPEIVAQLDPWTLGDTLWAIIYADYYQGVEVADVNATLDHFLDATAAQVVPDYLDWAMNQLAQNGNLDGVNIVVDHLSPEIVAQLDPWTLGDTLWAIIYADDYQGVEVADVNATLDHFLDATAAQVVPDYLDWTMLQLAFYGNLDGVNIVVDHLTPEIMAQLDPGTLGQTLITITNAVFYYQGIEVSDVNATIDNFLDTLGDVVHVDAVAVSLSISVQFGNIEGAAIVLDHITPDMAPAIAYNTGGEELQYLAYYSHFDYYSDDPEVYVDVTNTYMQILGPYVDPANANIDFAVYFFAEYADFDGVNAIIDNLTEAQLDAFGQSHPIYNDPMTVSEYLAAQDIYIGTSAGEWIYGTENSDVIYGGQGDDYLWGYNNGGSDTLYGNDGNDYLFGSLDNSDTINGGAGNDILYGGNTADTYIFDNLDGVDTLYTFSAAVGDVLDFSALLDGYDPVTDAITDFLIATDNGNSVTIAVDGDGTGTEQTATDVVTVLNTPDLDIQALVDGGTIIV